LFVSLCFADDFVYFRKQLKMHLFGSDWGCSA